MARISKASISNSKSKTKRNMFAAFEEEEVITPTMRFKKLIAADPILTAMLNGTAGSWGDLLTNDEISSPVTATESRRYQEVRAKMEREEKASKEIKEAKQKEEDDEMKDEAAYLTSLWASEDYWAQNHCTCMHFDEPGQFECRCFVKIHLDANGEPEECRFFNSPAGCRDGESCFYKHVKRDISEIPCRFESTEVGCNPGHGRKCPYMHLLPQKPQCCSHNKKQLSWRK